MDKVLIRELRIEAIIGIFPWEREVRQTLLIDMDIGADLQQAALSGDLDKTINYAAVCERVTALAEEGKYELIESLAEQIAKVVLTEFAAETIKVTAFKLDVMTQVAKVGVSIERSRSV